MKMSVLLQVFLLCSETQET